MIARSTVVSVSADVLAEAGCERFWRDRCGEPNYGDWPIRCRRDLSHESPHVGLRGDEAIVWPGVGRGIGEGLRSWGRKLTAGAEDS